MSSSGFFVPDVGAITLISHRALAGEVTKETRWINRPRVNTDERQGWAGAARAGFIVARGVTVEFTTRRKGLTE